MVAFQSLLTRTFTCKMFNFEKNFTLGETKKVFEKNEEAKKVFEKN